MVKEKNLFLDLQILHGWPGRWANVEHGWMDGGMNGGMDGWMDGWMVWRSVIRQIDIGLASSETKCPI